MAVNRYVTVFSAIATVLLNLLMFHAWGVFDGLSLRWQGYIIPQLVFILLFFILIGVGFGAFIAGVAPVKDVGGELVKTIQDVTGYSQDELKRAGKRVGRDVLKRVGAPEVFVHVAVQEEITKYPTPTEILAFIREKLEPRRVLAAVAGGEEEAPAPAKQSGFQKPAFVLRGRPASFDKMYVLSDFQKKTRNRALIALGVSLAVFALVWALRFYGIL